MISGCDAMQCKMQPVMGLCMSMTVQLFNEDIDEDLWRSGQVDKMSQG